MNARAEAYERLGRSAMRHGYSSRPRPRSAEARGSPTTRSRAVEVPAGRTVVSPVGTGRPALGRPGLDRPRPRGMVRGSLARRLPATRASAGEARAHPGRAAPPRRARGLAGAAQGQRQDRTALHPRRVRDAVLRRRRPGSRQRRRNSSSRTRPASAPRAITTLAAAADHIGRDLLPDDVQLDRERLDVDPAAAAFLGDWYGFAASVLEELRAVGRQTMPTPRACSYGQSTSTLPSSWAAKPAGPAPPTGCLPETTITPSPTCTSRRGSRPRRASSGRRRGSPAPSSPTRRCSTRGPARDGAGLLRARLRALAG